jgi:hypothetical protein
VNVLPAAPFGVTVNVFVAFQLAAVEESVVWLELIVLLPAVIAAPAETT